MAETDDLVLDFNDAPPAQGGGAFDYVPEGTYVLRVDKAELQESRNGKPMIVTTLMVDRGDYKGKKIRGGFVIPRAGTEDAKFGLQRFHQLIVACGAPEQTKKKKAAPIVKAIVGKLCVGEVEDNVMPATEDRKERTVSDPVAFYGVKSKEAKERLGGNSAKPKAEEPTEEPAEEPEEAEAKGTDEPTVSDEWAEGLFE